MKPNYFDIHSHIQEKEFNKDRDEVIGRMRENNIWSCIVGVDYESSKQAVEVASLGSFGDGLFAVVGLSSGTERPPELLRGCVFVCVCVYGTVDDS